MVSEATQKKVLSIGNNYIGPLPVSFHDIALLCVGNATEQCVNMKRIW